MSYSFYANHPVFDLFGSFDPFDEQPQPRAFGGRCEGGPGARFRRGGSHHGFHHRRHHHEGPWHGPHHHGCGRSPEREETPAEPEVYSPPADVYSTETDYKVYISLPSAEKETIELTYDPNTRELAVSGTLVRPAEFANLDEEALKNVLLQSERKLGKFQRKLQIPRDDNERIRFEEAVAKFENGVLELTLPKVDKESPKTIVID